MFCKECGKSISDDSKFCSYCGSKVEPIESPDRPEPSIAEVTGPEQGVRDIHKDGLHKVEGGNENSRKINLKRTAHFNWDLDGFPSEDSKKEKKVDLAWGDVLLQGNKEERSKEDDSLHKMIFGFEPDESKPETDVSSSVDSSANINSMDSNRVNKFYTFNKKNEEFQRLLDREYEKLKQDENYENTKDDVEEVPPSNIIEEDGTIEPERSREARFKGFSEHGISTSDASLSDGGREVSVAGGGTPWDSETDMGLLEKGEQSDTLPGDATETDEESISAAVASGSGESMGGLTSKVAAGGAAALSAAREGELELQEIVAAGEGAGSGSKGATEGASLGELAGSGDSQGDIQGRRRRGRADNRKKTKFNFQAIFDDEGFSGSGDSGEQIQAGAEDVETTLKEDVVSDEAASPEAISATEDQKEEKAIEGDRGEKAELGESHEDSHGVSQEESQEAGKPRSKALHVLSILFYTVLLIVIIVLGIKLIAPDSSLALKIDRTYDNIIHMITGKHSPANNTEDMEELKTVDDWIADSASSNQNIDKVKSAPELKVDITNKDFRGVDASRQFSDSTWYTDDDGHNVHYGENIVKSVIAYFSDLNSTQNGINGEKVETLKIGEIRTGEFGFFVATAVNEKGNSDNQYTIYVEPEGTTMKVADVEPVKKSE